MTAVFEGPSSLESAYSIVDDWFSGICKLSYVHCSRNEWLISAAFVLRKLIS